MRCTPSSIEVSDCAEAHRHALGLRALHAAVGVEQAAQEAAVELARAALDGGRDRLAARAQAELARELGDAPRAEAELAAAADSRASRRIRRDDCRRRAASSAAAMTEFGPPDAHVAVADRADAPRRTARARCLADRAVADQQAHEVTLVGARCSSRAAQAAARAMILQQHLVAGLEIAGRAPLGGQAPARQRRDAAHAMIGGEAQRDDLPRS